MGVFDVKETVGVKLKGANGEDSGIEVFVRPITSREVAQAQELAGYERLHKMAEAKVDRLTPEEMVEQGKSLNEKMSLALIADWDFGGNSFGELEADAPCDDENKLYFVRHPAYSMLIERQLVDAATSLGNFTPPLLSGVRNISKKK